MAGAEADAIDRLLTALAGSSLVILDNCEHLLDAAAELAERILGAAPGAVLATSREPLGMLGEAVLPVEPLGQPQETAAVERSGVGGAAVRRAGQRRSVPDFALTRRTWPRRPDLPPAGRAAAGHRAGGGPAAGLTPRQLADRLDGRFQLLTGGSRTALPRQQTLRAVVDWSWDLLEAAGAGAGRGCPCSRAAATASGGRGRGVRRRPAAEIRPALRAGGQVAAGRCGADGRRAAVSDAGDDPEYGGSSGSPRRGRSPRIQLRAHARHFRDLAEGGQRHRLISRRPARPGCSRLSRGPGQPARGGARAPSRPGTRPDRRGPGRVAGLVLVAAQHEGRGHRADHRGAGHAGADGSPVVRDIERLGRGLHHGRAAGPRHSSDNSQALAWFAGGGPAHGRRSRGRTTWCMRAGRPAAARCSR